jgi:hypothetical protein
MKQISKITVKKSNDKAAFSNWPIKSYGFYIARQGGYDQDMNYSEICAILEIKTNHTQIESKSFNKIEILFRSAGEIDPQSEISSNTLHLELSDKDLLYWQLGLKNIASYLDIRSFDEANITVFLFSGRMENTNEKIIKPTGLHIE